jgi:lysine decarboxylase
MEKTINKQELKDIKIFKNYPKQMIKPRDAYNSSKMDVKIEDSLGFISAESIMIYPPGIPLIVAGEQIDQNIIDIMIDYINDGIVLYKDSPDGMIRVAKI